MDFTTLLTHLKAGDTEKALEVAEALKPKFDQTIQELNGFESKLSDAVETRDKAKNRLKTIADVFGIAVDELTPEKVTELRKVGKNDDEYKADIENLTKLIEQKDADHKSSLETKDNQFRDKMIEIEISKIGIGSDVVNDKALELVIASLKDGATLDENGAVIYKDGNGTDRNGAGRPTTVSERMDSFKSDPTNAFLFKATDKGGGGAQGSGSAGTKKFSEMTGAELVELRRTNPAEYDRLKNQS